MEETIISKFSKRIKNKATDLQSDGRIGTIARKVAHLAHPGGNKVVFFNASTRLGGLSQNAAFSLLTAWSMRTEDVDVVHFVCNHGMTHCVLGTDREDLEKAPPCSLCVARSNTLFQGANIHWFENETDLMLQGMLGKCSLIELTQFQYLGMELGAIVLPSLRWILRRYHIPDTEPARILYRDYILSAWNIARRFAFLLDEVKPTAVVLFNGQFYPEAVAKQVASSRHIRVITHEVGSQPLTGFFTAGEATAYPINIPDDFYLDNTRNERLDKYLSERFQGNFTMAGIKFWSQMKGLDEGLKQRIAGFKQLVPVFTNVIFDTSQEHANAAFNQMFDWLDQVLAIIKTHPDTFFIIRAHPDEKRSGKESRESVSSWAALNRLEELRNVLFVDSDQPLSSYELIGMSKFVMVYNSTIGLEAVLLGKPVLCAGMARYTQLPTVFQAKTPGDFRSMALQFLAEGIIDTPPEFLKNARRFMYYQLFKTSLPFGDYLETGTTPGYVVLKEFPVEALYSKNSPTMRVIRNGILGGGNFILDEEK